MTAEEDEVEDEGTDVINGERDEFVDPPEKGARRRLVRRVAVSPNTLLKERLLRAMSRY